MKLYRIHYTDDSDVGCPTFTQQCRATSAEHAEYKFFESDDESAGWKILKIEKVKES